MQSETSQLQPFEKNYVIFFVETESEVFIPVYQRLGEITVYMVYFYVFQSVLLYKVI